MNKHENLSSNPQKPHQGPSTVVNASVTSIILALWKQQQYWACWLPAKLQVKQGALSLQEVWWKVIKQDTEYPPWVLRADTHSYMCMHTTLPSTTLLCSLSPRVCDQTLYQAVVVVMGKLLPLRGVLLSPLHSGMSSWWSTGHMWLKTAVKAGPIQSHRFTESTMNWGILFFFLELDCLVLEYLYVVTSCHSGEGLGTPSRGEWIQLH